MNSRRSFLRLLGIGAVAAPAVASMAVEAAPVSAVAVNAKYRRYLVEAQREYVREDLFQPYVESIDNNSFRVWQDWAVNAVKSRDFKPEG